MPPLFNVKRKLFGISTEESLFSKRGFNATVPVVQDKLEKVGKSFINGYNTALESDDLEDLNNSLNQVSSEFRGFAFEGAAMALAIIDRVTFSDNTRFNKFLNGPANQHKYMLHVGAGWAMARLPWGWKQHFESLDPLLRWLALDGYGFHEAYFHPTKTVFEQQQPKKFSGYELRVFDQGVGRGLWFVKGARVDLVADTIHQFNKTRHADLWSGVGLASTYAGGVEQEALRYLYKASHEHFDSLAQGAAFAAKARQLAGNSSSYTDMACLIYLGVSAAQAASFCDVAERGLTHVREIPAYEEWRQSIRVMANRREVA